MHSGDVNALAVEPPRNADPTTYTIFVPMCEGGVLRKTLIPDGVDEERARRGRVDEVGALAFVTRLEIRELACLVAVPSCPKIFRFSIVAPQICSYEAHLQREQLLRASPPSFPQ